MGRVDDGTPGGVDGPAAGRRCERAAQRRGDGVSGLWCGQPGATWVVYDVAVWRMEAVLCAMKEALQKA